MNIFLTRDRVSSFADYKTTFGVFPDSDPSKAAEQFRGYLLRKLSKKEDPAPWNPIKEVLVNSPPDARPLDHCSFLIGLEKDELEKFVAIEQKLAVGNYDGMEKEDPKLFSKAFLRLPISQRVRLAESFEHLSSTINLEHPSTKQAKTGQELFAKVESLPQSSHLKAFILPKIKEIPLEKVRHRVIDCMQVFAKMVGKTPLEMERAALRISPIEEMTGERYDPVQWNRAIPEILYDQFVESFKEDMPEALTAIRDSKKNTLDDKISKSLKAFDKLPKYKSHKDYLSAVPKREHYEAAFESGPLASLGDVGLFWYPTESFSDQFEAKRGLERLYVSALVKLGPEKGISLDPNILMQYIETCREGALSRISRQFSKEEIKAAMKKEIGALRKACNLGASQGSLYEQYKEFRQAFSSLYSRIKTVDGSLKSLFLQEAYLNEDVSILNSSLEVKEVKVEDLPPPPPKIKQTFESLAQFSGWMEPKQNSNSPLRSFFEAKGVTPASLETLGLNDSEKLVFINQGLDLFTKCLAQEVSESEAAKALLFDELDALATKVLNKRSKSEKEAGFSLQTGRSSSSILWFAEKTLKACSSWLQDASFKEPLGSGVQELEDAIKAKKSVNVCKTIADKLLDDFQKKISQEIDRLKLPLLYKDLLEKRIKEADFENLNKIFFEVGYARYSKMVDTLWSNTPGSFPVCKYLQEVRGDWKERPLPEKFELARGFLKGTSVVSDEDLRNCLMLQLTSLPFDFPSQDLLKKRDEIFVELLLLKEESPLRKYLRANLFSLVDAGDDSLALYCHLHKKLVDTVRSTLPTESALRKTFDKFSPLNAPETERLLTFVQSKKPLNIKTCCDYGLTIPLVELLRGANDEAIKGFIKHFEEMTDPLRMAAILKCVYVGGIGREIKLFTRLIMGPAKRIGFEFLVGQLLPAIDESTAFDTVQKVILGESTNTTKQNQLIALKATQAVLKFQEWIHANPNSLVVAGLKAKKIITENGQIIHGFPNCRMHVDIRDFCLATIDLMRLQEGERHLTFFIEFEGADQLLSQAEEWLQKEKKGKARRCTKEELYDLFKIDEGQELSGFSHYLNQLGIPKPKEDLSAEEYYLLQRSIKDRTYAGAQHLVMALELSTDKGEVYPEILQDPQSIMKSLKAESLNLDRARFDDLVCRIIYTMYEIALRSTLKGKSKEINKIVADQLSTSSTKSAAARIAQATAQLDSLRIVEKSTEDHLRAVLSKDAWGHNFKVWVETLWAQLRDSPLKPQEFQSPFPEGFIFEAESMIQKEKDTLANKLGYKIVDLMQKEVLKPQYIQLLEPAYLGKHSDLLYYLCQDVSYAMFTTLIDEEKAPTDLLEILNQPLLLDDKVKRCVKYLEEHSEVENAQEMIDTLNWKRL